MGVEWYDMLARRNGGYRSRAVYSVEGRSAEDVFEERLVRMLPQYRSVLDAGCGHGEFTLKMAGFADRITGFDNSQVLIQMAQSLLAESGTRNVEFVYATTKTELPFENEQFDLIYDRRGPTSIINHSRVLAAGGRILGIHNNVDAVRARLAAGGYKDIVIEEFNEAVTYFPDEMEFAKFLGDIPGNPDYSQPELREELEVKIEEYRMGGRLGIREHKFIWSAAKP